MSTSNGLESAQVTVPPVLAAQMPGQCGCDPNAISTAMGEAFDALMTFIQRHSLVPSGPPRTIYTTYGPEGTKFVVVMPIVALPHGPLRSGPGSVDTIPGGKALRFTHRGPYRELMTTYGKITHFMLSKGLMKSEADWANYMPMWEEYLNDPDITPEADLVTHIYLPLG